MRLSRRLAGRSTLVLAALATVVLLWITSAPVSSGPTSWLLGDANCDQGVNSIDATFVLQLDAGLLGSVPCPQNADVRFDGSINSVDAALILQSEAGLLTRCHEVQPGEEMVAELILIDHQTSFAPGEPVSMMLTFTNCGHGPVTRGYGTAQQYDFTVSNASGEEVWRWSRDRAFALVVTYQTFEPGETTVYGATWDQLTNDGEPVPPGMYSALGYDVGCNETRPGQCEFGDRAVLQIEP